MVGFIKDAGGGGVGIDTTNMTATPSDILLDKTAVVNDQVITGNIPSRPASIILPGTSDAILDAGQYLAGAQTIKGDVNLLPANILKGANLFGVEGAATNDATAVAADLLSGKTAYSKGVKLSGAMTNRGATVITPGTVNKAINAGYHNGNGYVQGDSKLIPANIKSGLSIFGVTGNYTGGIYYQRVTANLTRTISLSGFGFTPIKFLIYSADVMTPNREYATILTAQGYIPNNGNYSTYGEYDINIRARYADYEDTLEGKGAANYTYLFTSLTMSAGYFYIRCINSYDYPNFPLYFGTGDNDQYDVFLFDHV